MFGVRLSGEDSKVYLTMLLHGISSTPGQYDPAAVEAFQKLQAKYGEKLEF